MNWFSQTTKRWKTEGYGSSGVILWTNMATTGTNRGRFLLWHVKGKQLARLYINSMETHKCHKPNVKCLLKNVFVNSQYKCSFKKCRFDKRRPTTHEEYICHKFELFFSFFNWNIQVTLFSSGQWGKSFLFVCCFLRSFLWNSSCFKKKSKINLIIKQPIYRYFDVFHMASV